ncbi:protein POLAR-like 1 [Raphanus sativus]|uniref:Protein POLAR-like 1 n=1 Tax=Raphanus sativus TaxID=3726 RepID=A0A6J0KC75_RAPSA|nr:protein POLAR-like 1 [Raphanus sativus]
MDGGGRVRTGCIRIRHLSPRRVMARLFSSPSMVKGKKKKAMVEGRVRDCDSTRIINDPHDSLDSELRRREFLFGIGMSCYLLHLIANGREEIHKIVELRNDIEKLLECKNDEMRRKQQEFVELRNDIDKLLQYHNDDLRRKQQRFVSGKQEQYCETTTSDFVGTSSDCYYSPQLLETSLSVGGEGSFKPYVFKGKGEDFGGDIMDQLEAELEAEFELLRTGQNQEKSDDSRGIRPLEEQQGVCPYELERRLHELMETRQEEKINELECALEDAKKRLHVKEAEASWWKDTACIVSEHIPQPSKIKPNSQTRQYPLSR